MFGHGVFFFRYKKDSNMIILEVLMCLNKSHFDNSYDH